MYSFVSVLSSIFLINISVAVHTKAWINPATNLLRPPDAYLTCHPAVNITYVDPPKTTEICSKFIKANPPPGYRFEACWVQVENRIYLPNPQLVEPTYFQDIKIHEEAHACGWTHPSWDYIVKHLNEFK